MASSPLPTPALAPPPGVTPNFENPDSLWMENVLAQTFCMGIAGVVFFLRTYIRLGFSQAKREWIAEDWMVCLSFIGLVIYSAILTTIMENKGGVHQWNLTVPEAQKILYYFWVESVVYGPFVFFTKVSILLLYMRVFVPRRWSAMWWTVYSFIAVSSMFYIAITLVKIWQCNPRERIWDKTRPGTCIDIAALLSASGFFNTFTDAFLLLIPIRSVWNLKMSLRKKVGVCFVLSIGAIAPVFSAIGFAVRVRTASSKDASYNLPLILLWGTAEVTTGVICACLPTLHVLVRGRLWRRKKSVVTTSANPAPPRTPSYGLVSQRSKASKNEYLELDESFVMPRHEYPAPIHASIRGGLDSKPGSESSHTDIERLIMSNEENPSQIVRTVEITQSEQYHGI